MTVCNKHIYVAKLTASISLQKRDCLISSDTDDALLLLSATYAKKKKK